MKRLMFAIMMIFLPALAQSQSISERQEIVKNIDALLPQIKFTAVGSPVFVGDNNPFVIKMAPISESREPVLFPSGSYIIPSSALEPQVLGIHLCNLASQFILEERKARANFLEGVEVTGGLKKSAFNFEFKLSEPALEGLYRGILFLYDQFAGNDRSFELLVIGAADAAKEGFSRPLHERMKIKEVLFHPPNSNDPTQHSIYDRKTDTFAITDPYGNEQLPLLRAEYMKRILDSFLRQCKLEPKITRPPRVLRGHTSAGTRPDIRGVSVYFYVHEPN